MLIVPFPEIRSYTQPNTSKPYLRPKKLLELAVAEELKKKALQQVFVTADQKKQDTENISVYVELKSKRRQILTDELSS